MPPSTVIARAPDAAPGDPVGMLAIRQPDNRGVVRVMGWGSWSPAYVDTHFAELGRLLDEVRAAGRPIRVLVNLQKAPQQTPEAVARLRAGSNATYQPGDRVALVVESSMVKLRMHTLFDRTKLSFFVSETAAVLWLTPDLSWQRDAGTWHL